MATIRSFEEIEAWQKARSLAHRVFLVTRRNDFCRDYSLRDQIRRASSSVMDNIAEGFEREGRNEFIQLLSYAKGSAGEVRSQLYQAFDRQYITRSEFDLLKADYESLSRMIAGFMKYLKSSTVRGHKFKDRPENQ